MNEPNQKTLKELHAITRGQLIGKYGIAIITCMTLSLTEAVILMLTTSGAPTSAVSYLVKVAISIIIDLLMGVLVYGQTYFFLQLVRGDANLNTGYLFYGIKNNMDKAIMVEGVFTLISCVMLIPTILINMDIITVSEASYPFVALIIESADLIIRIIAKLFLGLSFYILCDHPEYDVKEILVTGINLMNGKKTKLLLVFLSCIPMVIIGILACCIGLLWFAPYMQTLLANFYLDAIGEEPYSGRAGETPPPKAGDTM